MDFINKDDRDRLYDYHKHNLSYTGDYIKFADGKAGVALGATLIMIGFFGNQVKENGFRDMSILEYNLLIGLIPLVIASVIFIWLVLWPRYKTKNNDYMSWAGIGSFPDAAAYVNQIEGITDEQLIHDMGRQNYSLAKVCIKKYKFLKYGFIALSVGAIIESISWLFIK